MNVPFNELPQPCRYNGAVINTSVSGVVRTAQNLDAFERLRVSLPQTAYEYNFQYGKADCIWAEKIGGAGLATHVPASSSITLTTGVARTVAQVKLVGYGDSENGFFIGQDDIGIFALLRSSSSGVLSDARKVYQNAWNLDKLDGFGDSRILLDIEKVQILVIDAQWLGSGLVRFGFDIGGKVIYFHQFTNANIIDTAYTTSANLPIHYSIFDGVNLVVRQTYEYMRYRPGKSIQIFATFKFGLKTANSMSQICAAVITETANDPESYYQFSIGTGITPQSTTTTYIPVLSVRPKALFNGIINRGQISIDAVELLVFGNGIVHWVLVYNGTLTAPVWDDSGTNSIVEYDVSATAYTPGTGCPILEGYATSTATSRFTVDRSVKTKIPIALDIDGANPKTITLIARTVSLTVDVYACFITKQLY